MSATEVLKQGIHYLKNQDVDIRIRMLLFMEYATLVASVIGTVVMSFYSSFIILVPNFILILFCLAGIYVSRVKKAYDWAVRLIIIGCAYISLPIMFVTAGGNLSGMPIWFVFGIAFSCMMSKGKERIIMTSISLVLMTSCMILGYLFPNAILPLEDSKAQFLDMLQSFIIVSAILGISLNAYLNAYDVQRKQLLKQSEELKSLMSVDALTGINNRRAYYEDTEQYKDSSVVNDLVLLTMDLNGLKKINDNLGHSAGDAYLKTASDIIKNVLSTYGKIYRTGGDEFMAVLFCKKEIAEIIPDMINNAIITSENEWTDNMSVAIGTVCWSEHKEMSFADVEKLADQRMYQNKSEFYRKNGLDRRKT